MITDAVQYCPMNLFNRDQKRIEKGVEGLWNGWIKTEGTGNNFRIALDGKWLNPNDVR